MLDYQNVASGLREVSSCSVYQIATEICQEFLAVILAEGLGLYNVDTFELLILPGLFRLNSSGLKDQFLILGEEHTNLVLLSKKGWIRFQLGERQPDVLRCQLRADLEEKLSITIIAHFYYISLQIAKHYGMLYPLIFSNTL